MAYTRVELLRRPRVMTEPSPSCTVVSKGVYEVVQPLALRAIIPRSVNVIIASVFNF